jgi:hypothetical protein
MHTEELLLNYKYFNSIKGKVSKNALEKRFLCFEVRDTKTILEHTICEFSVIIFMNT